MNKINKILWHLISTVICVFYRSDANGYNGYIATTNMGCCTTTTELLVVYNDHTNATGTDRHKLCSDPGSYINQTDYYDPNTPSPISWDSYQPNKPTITGYICSNNYYLSSCVKKNTNNILSYHDYDDIDTFIAQCDKSKLSCIECPLGGQTDKNVSIRITMIPTSNPRYICTIAQYEHSTLLGQQIITNNRLKIYKHTVDCSKCPTQNTAPKISDCYQPATTDTNNIYETDSGYFELSSNCSAQ